jgi:hypothetical protein
MSERRIWGDAEAETGLTDRQLELAKHYEELGDLEPTDRNLRLAALPEKRRRAGSLDLKHLRAESAKQDKKRIKEVWAELTPADSSNPDVLTFLNTEGEA